MKKINTNKIVAVLAVLCLITSAFVGSTLAKYTTSAEAGDTARVAKFGVTVAATGDTAFADMYGTGDEATTEATAATVVTSGATGDSLVAPGTKGNLGSFTISGTPEVDVKIDYEIKFELGNGWAVENSAYYCPLEITVGSTTIKGTEQSTAEAFEIAVEDAIATELGMTATNNGNGTYTKTVDSNTSLEDSVSVAWEWKYEGNDDAKDTYLGDQAATSTAAAVEFSIKGTVTQVD